MALYQFHRLLIVASILGDFAFTFFCIRKYNNASQTVRDGWGVLDHPITWAVASSLAVVALAAYLIHFSRNLAVFRAMLEHQPRCENCGYDLRGSTADASATTCPECGADVSAAVGNATAG